MRNILLILVMVSASHSLFGQVIKGTILDGDTREPVISAAVYFNGTSVGTLSDHEGNFTIDATKYGRMPLTISAIGYHSFSLKDFSAGKKIQVLLQPKTFELREVEVNAKSFAARRKQNLAIFRNEFLGRNVNASGCRFLNPDDIRFRYSDNEDTVIAYATKPILIRNGSLGYNLTYYLDRFEYDRKNRMFLFSGELLFSEDSASNADQQFSYSHQRNESYLGSRMHFFRALWINDLENEGFKVRNAAGKIVTYNDIVYEADNRTKYLDYPTKLSITYLSDPVASYIVFIGGNVYFDPSGYYDATKISWEGRMASQRIADQLPYDYLP